ncbi:MAG: type II toxin-antitoxin system VapC family toxin [Rhodoferax sp.]|jgi:predicted nucleic acid-binding protein|uniref:type II toxin-antitoxin system VapC family toxin n=1 Tax=Rhodoferax sp. TaxID=50421 RepID=UPI001B4C4922|nr:type II toxin-antitoxin system VapC family toxin [Rhodoferax sp.]MBP8287646.1 type II toxin-antitoxin system VapC family toxin [Rhodoferax sp.]MBP9148657.1 type II toxin-antitoxin system VapC family toxin [Rhodoferax sp.]MBP9737559.1 type II toxin-antitoxin system VapC family toxin [Rhodoferax sp.]
MQLVDTNILSELMRPQPNAGVLTWLQGRERVKPRLTISVVTVDEIMFGLSWHPTARLLSWFDAFVQRHEVLPITSDIARRAGELRRQLQASGQTRTQADMLIAATAQIHARTIVTRNVRDFDGCGVGVLNPFTA